MPQGLRAPALVPSALWHSRAGPWLSPEPTNTDKGVSLIYFSFLFLISFIATAPGKWEVTAEESSWKQPGGFGRTDIRGKVRGAKSVGFDSAAAQRLSDCVSRDMGLPRCHPTLQGQADALGMLS